MNRVVTGKQEGDLKKKKVLKATCVVLEFKLAEIEPPSPSDASVLAR